MSDLSAFHFPQGEELHQLLELRQKANLEDLFARTLTEPLERFLSRPRKNLRCQLVELGFRIAQFEDSQSLRLACEMIEVLHAGSLVVDDIEDCSEERRGQPSLHKMYGVPVALNAANWLYFLPFKYIDELKIPEVRKANLHRECVNTLLRAHYGQALDVGIPLQSLSQNRVFEVSLSATELKTGVLAGFAMKLGSLLIGRDSEFLQKVDAIGRQLGMSLQMFDDIGNLTSSHNPKKRGEDLFQGRICFVAGVAAQLLSPTDYAEFLSHLQKVKSDPEFIHDWLQVRGILKAAKVYAQSYLDKVVDQMTVDFDLGSTEKILLASLRHYLLESYG